MIFWSLHRFHPNPLAPDYLPALQKLKKLSENGQILCPISFLSFQAQKQKLPHLFLPPPPSFLFHLHSLCMPHLFYHSHPESFCPSPNLLLPFCSSLTTLGSPSDPHTLWCSSRLTQVYSFCNSYCSPSGRVGGVWVTRKVSPGVQPLIAWAPWGASVRMLWLLRASCSAQRKYHDDLWTAAGMEESHHP